MWDRETAELHAEGEAAAGLLPAVAWQPNGRHLYAAVCKPAAGLPGAEQPPSQQEGQQGHQRPDESEQALQAAAEGIQHVGAWKRELRRRQQQREAAAAPGGADSAAAASCVLLFERNGLQHGGFDVPPAAAGGASAIEQLAWSPDSEFLAVVLAEDDEDGGCFSVSFLEKGGQWVTCLGGTPPPQGAGLERRETHGNQCFACLNACRRQQAKPPAAILLCPALPNGLLLPCHYASACPALPPSCRPAAAGAAAVAPLQLAVVPQVRAPQPLLLCAALLVGCRRAAAAAHCLCRRNLPAGEPVLLLLLLLLLHVPLALEQGPRLACLAVSWVAGLRRQMQRCELTTTPKLLLLLLVFALSLQLQFSRQATVSGRGTAAVVDGSALLLTPLRHSGKRLAMAADAGVRGLLVLRPGSRAGTQHFNTERRPQLFTHHACLPCPACSGTAAHVRRHRRHARPRQLPGVLRPWGAGGRYTGSFGLPTYIHAAYTGGSRALHGMLVPGCCPTTPPMAVTDLLTLQALAAVLSDGSLALLTAVEDDLWEETLEEQLEQQPWDRWGRWGRWGSRAACGCVRAGLQARVHLPAWQAQILPPSL